MAEKLSALESGAARMPDTVGRLTECTEGSTQLGTDCQHVFACVSGEHGGTTPLAFAAALSLSLRRVLASLAG